MTAARSRHAALSGSQTKAPGFAGGYLLNQEGVTNDGLYLDTTLALNPDTGELAWYFQHQANGQWDLDWAFERQVMELPVNGVPTRVVVTGGK